MLFHCLMLVRDRDYKMKKKKNSKAWKGISCEGKALAEKWETNLISIAVCYAVAHKMKHEEEAEKIRERETRK